MGSTLGNVLTDTVLMTTNKESRKIKDIGDSLTTGQNQMKDVVDGFLGNSLKDTEVIQSSIAKNIGYTVNALTIAQTGQSKISESLQKGLKTITSASNISTEKRAVLQNALDLERKQVNDLIKGTEFDGRALLSGAAKSVSVQTGRNVGETFTMAINDISDGKLFRSSISTALTDLIKNDTNNDLTSYYKSSDEKEIDVIDNINLIHSAIKGEGGSGTGDAISDKQLAELV
jgi:hypothetical protein